MWTSDDPDRSAEGLLIASGVVLGPAIGYWSAGMSGRGWKTLGLRTGLFLLSFLPAFAICGWDCTVGDRDYDLAWAVIASGAGFGAASAVYDLARMKRNVRAHRVRQTAPGIGITPTYIPQTHTLGLRVSVVF
jgi:Na+-transporting NADH:ubiquinone oxidoreductase subunit NqrE